MGETAFPLRVEINSGEFFYVPCTFYFMLKEEWMIYA